MTDYTKGENQEGLRAELEDKQIGDLRKFAKKNKIGLEKTDNKMSIIDKIVEATKHVEYLSPPDEDSSPADDLKPGWALIKVHPVPGRPSFPAYVNANGYECFIPLNVETQVPIRVIKSSLKDAEEFIVERNAETNEVKQTFQQSYPFTVLAIKPGADPRPGIEVQREKALKPKRDFFSKYGIWPTDSQMQEFKLGTLFSR